MRIFTPMSQSKNRLLISGCVVLIMLAAGFAGYYWSNNRHQVALAQDSIRITTTTPSNLEVSLVATNGAKDTSESCIQGYNTGTFSLVVRDRATDTEIDRIDLGELLIPDTGLRILEAKKGATTTSFALVASYGSCNGDEFQLLALPTIAGTKIQQAAFENPEADSVFADKNNGVNFVTETGSNTSLVVTSYDNTTAKHNTDTYSWDGLLTFHLDKQTTR